MDSADAPMLEASGVSKRYRRRAVLRGVDLSARRGSVVAILGENGSGKSTLLRILAGRERMDQGRIERRGTMGYCPQDPLLYPYLTVDEHFQLFGCAYALSARQSRVRADQLLDRFAFESERTRLVAELSGGTQQKLNLALALMHEPELVLLDEPYSALDIDSYRRFMDWIEDARRRGVCIVLVTHLLFEGEQRRFDLVCQLREGLLHATAS